MKRIQTDIIGVAILVALFLACNYAWYRKGYKNGENNAIETIITQIDTVVRYDSIKVVEPKYVAVKVVDTIRVPVPIPGKTDTLWAELPREQKTYKEDSVYVCAISGYQPQLDTLVVFPKTTTITVNNTVTQYKDPRFSLGVQAGYGVSKAGLSPYIGVGISYNIINIKGRP